MAVATKAHAVCISYPHQSHIKATLNLAKLLHHKGFHITFVNTEYNHNRLLKSRGPNSLNGLPHFRFETIPDGLPPLDSSDNSQDARALCLSIRHNFLSPFLNLIAKINASASADNPPVTCIVADGLMPFTILAAQELGIPVVHFFTLAACGVMGYYHFQSLLDKGLAPLKDLNCLTNGHLDTIIDWIPGMKDIRLKDLPGFLRTTDPDDILFHFLLESAHTASKASAVVIHTFDALEPDVLNALECIYPLVYTIGPLQLFLDQLPKEDPLNSIGCNMWKEESECLEWLDSKQPNSVLYLNFGSVIVMTEQQLVEFCWGLANSKHYFLWIIRPDLVVGKSATLPPEFILKTKEKGFITSWCPQEQVLNHPSVGGFLTHSGWNSTIESLSAGVPMLCWPVSADQPTNCKFTCTEWGVGMEIESDIKRDQLERLVRELMEGEQGKKMRQKALEWKEMAEEATNPQGSSFLNLERLVNLLLPSKS